MDLHKSNDYLLFFEACELSLPKYFDKTSKYSKEISESTNSPRPLVQAIILSQNK